MTGRRLSDLREEFRAYAAAFDASVIDVDLATEVVSEAARIESIAAALKAAAAAKVAATSVWRNEGHRSAADWLADTTGTTRADAQQIIGVGERLEALPTTAAKARAGDLSPRQTAVIADAATADPSAERELLEAARRESLGELRERCQRTKAAADANPDATRARVHAARSLRRWIDPEGVWNMLLRNTPDVGARIEAVLGPEIDAQLKKARKEGRRETYEACAADALVDLICDDRAPEADRRPSTNPKFMSLVRIDGEALRRGHVEPGEVCEIAGIGPIPVSVARDVLGESILKLVITRGVDVLNVTHLGRGANAAQQVALWWSSPSCTVLGCSRCSYLENDHRIPFAEVRETATTNLDPYCYHHHDLKTRFGWELVEGKGKREMVPPDDPRHPKRKRAAAA